MLLVWFLKKWTAHIIPSWSLASSSVRLCLFGFFAQSSSAIRILFPNGFPVWQILCAIDNNDQSIAYELAWVWLSCNCSRYILTSLFLDHRQSYRRRYRQYVVLSHQERQELLLTWLRLRNFLVVRGIVLYAAHTNISTLIRLLRRREIIKMISWWIKTSTKTMTLRKLHKIWNIHKIGCFAGYAHSEWRENESRCWRLGERIRGGWIRVKMVAEANENWKPRGKPDLNFN